MSLNSDTYPFSLCLITSVNPVLLKITDGKLHAEASNATNPKASSMLGAANKSAAL